MYLPNPNPTDHACFTILSELDSHLIDTSWVRLIWNLTGITNNWLMSRCIELANRYDIELTESHYWRKL